MRVVALSLAVLVAGLLSTPAQAELLVGLTEDSGLLGINVEVAGSAGSAYVVIGAYQARTGIDPANLTGIVGLRRFQDGKFNQNGYFGGIFLGDVGGGTDYNRYGAGGELGYQWLTDHLRMTMHAGVALMGEASGPQAPVASSSVEPAPLLGASISLRF